MQTWQKMNQIEAFIVLNCKLKRLVHINGKTMKKCHHNSHTLNKRNLPNRHERT